MELPKMVILFLIKNVLFTFENHIKKIRNK